MSRRTWILGLLLAGVGGAITVGGWMTGQLVAPQPAQVALPAGFVARDVELPMAGGGFVRGWWRPAAPDRPAILLLHGVRSNRLAMVERGRVLAKQGYSVLMIDLPAHGESPGAAITLGLNESRGVVAARDWLRRQRPGQKIGVIGVSLGGASLLLGPQPCGFDAVVLEAVYPDVHRAITDRLAIRVGAAAPLLTPLLEWQLQPRLGIAPEQLRPIDRIALLGAPVLIVAGGRDRHTPLAESREMFERARGPKDIWILPGAAHEDFLARDDSGYRQHVLEFLERNLAGPPHD